MARPASLSETWLPAYGWWPPTGSYDVTVILTPYHATVDPEAEYAFHLRGYAGSTEPVWEHSIERLPFGEQRAIRLADLGIPDPPEGAGGVLEVQGVRLDRPPVRGTAFVGMWIDAHGPDGGGYLIPTVPARGAAKVVSRDDLQVVPGIHAGAETNTEILLLNVVDETTEVRLVASSPDGLVGESKPFEIDPLSAWHGDLSRAVPRLRRLLEPSGGIGSLAIYSSHRLLPFFGFRKEGQPIVSLDHSAPIFAPVFTRRRTLPRLLERLPLVRS